MTSEIRAGGRHRGPRSGKDDDPGQLGDSPGLVPGGQLRRRIGAQQQHQRGPGSRGRDRRRVSRYTRVPGRSSSAPLDAKPGEPASARISIAARCSGELRCCPRLNGCSRAGTKRSDSQPERLAGDLPHDQMSVVHGIERPAEEADHPALRLRGFGGTDFVCSWCPGMESANVAAGLLHVLAVSQASCRPAPA